MTIDAPEEHVDIDDEGSEMSLEVPIAPVSQTRAVTAKLLTGQQSDRQTPVPPAFSKGPAKKKVKIDKWAELSEGVRPFHTGSYRGS